LNVGSLFRFFVGTDESYCLFFFNQIFKRSKNKYRKAKKGVVVKHEIAVLLNFILYFFVFYLSLLTMIFKKEKRIVFFFTFVFTINAFSQTTEYIRPTINFSVAEVPFVPEVPLEPEVPLYFTLF